tara:strand:+ start:4762 stop:5733 length:972 start_codon:yes stop_codon:yes gene_type:complete
MVKFSFRGVQDWVDSVDKETERRQDMAVKMMELDLAYGGGRSRSRSGTSGSSGQDLADKAAIMSQIKSRLPEDSQIVPQLAGASLETLKKFASGQDALYEYHLKHNIPYTAQEAEEDVISFHRVVEEVGPTLDSDQIMTTLGLTEDMLDEEIRPNVTFRDAIKDLTTPSEVVGATFSFAPTGDLLSAAEQTGIKDLYIDQLDDNLAATIGQLNNRANTDTAEPGDAERIVNLDAARKKLKAGQTSSAIQLAGNEAVNIAINIMKTNPNFKSYAYLINRNLNFESKDKLAQAINVGLIVEGTSILFQNGSYTVTQEDILRATGD